MVLLCRTKSLNQIVMSAQKKLNDFDSKLLQHAIVALPTKDELLLRGVVRDAFNSY